MNWIALTRDNSPSNGKEKIFISYYSENRRKVAETIKTFFLKISNCAVFYSDPDAEDLKMEDKRSALKQVACVTFPVFSRNMSVTKQMQEDLDICQAEHIPMIPILMDGEESRSFYDDYRAIFGNLQLLLPYHVDKTKRPFEQVLASRFESIVSLDADIYRKYQIEGYFPKEINQKIAEAFRGTIFLSYRKKDRNRAQDLIRQIHAEDDLTDIMIWYDEYLVLGEDFNDLLSRQIRSCDVFLILGSPASIEKDNYILTHEYPDALRSGKKIVLVCTERCTEADCSAAFSGADIIIKAADISILPKILYDLFQGSTTKLDKCPEEKAYFLGKAYLDGTLTEPDAEKGIALIRYAAEHSFLPAMKLLARMYQIGKGVKQDLEIWADWTEKATQCLRNQVKPSGNNAAVYQRLVHLYLDLGDYKMRMGSFHDAIDLYHEMLDVAIKLCAYDSEVLSHSTWQIIALTSIANIYLMLKEFDAARSCLEKALKVHDSIPGNAVRIGADQDYAFMLMTLAKLEFNQKNYEEAEYYYKICLEEAKTAAGLVMSARAFWIQCDVADHLGLIRQELGDTETAEEYFRQELALAESWLHEFEAPQAPGYISTAYYRIAVLYEKAKDDSTAFHYYQKAADQAEIALQAGTTQDIVQLYCVNCFSAAMILYGKREFAKAKACLRDTEFWMQHEKTCPLPLLNEMLFYNILGMGAYIEKRPARARMYYLKAISPCAARFRTQQTVANLSDLATIYYKVVTSHPYVDDLEAVRKACELYEMLLQETGNPQVEQLYHKMVCAKNNMENRIPMNREKVFRWMKELLYKTDMLEECGLKFGEGIRNRTRITTEIFELVMCIADSAEQFTNEFIEVLSRLMDQPLSRSEIESYLIMFQLVGQETRKYMMEKIPESIQFLCEAESLIKGETETDYHEGLSFMLRAIISVIVEWAADIFDSTGEKHAQVIKMIERIDLYIEEKSSASNADRRIYMQ